MRFTSMLFAAVTAGLAIAAPVEKRAKRFKCRHQLLAGLLQFSNSTSVFGVNESGPEFGNKNFPGTKGKDYVWPTLSTIDVSVRGLISCRSADRSDLHQRRVQYVPY